jgi:kinesin family protein 3/17
MNLSFPRKEQDDLQQKLRQLERKLIVGGENLLDKAAKQAQLLEESEQELEKRALNEEQLRKELQQKEVFSYSMMMMYLLCFSLG